VNALFILIPNQVGYIIDGRFKKMTGLPEILAHLAGLLPPQKSEPDLLI
jgi:hypothetical protein